MTAAVLDGSAGSRGRGDAEPLWPLHAAVFASSAIVLGLIWDISWHRSVGRDTFWSPPHLLEQLAAIVAGMSCGWVVLRTTFAGDENAKQRGVRFWGFYGPLGAWVCIWGTLMMIASAPFDDWWHNAYGLDVEILSPPHTILAWGMLGIQVGAMLTALARQNRATPEEMRRLGYVFLASGAMLLTMHATVLMEEARFPHLMHASRFYIVTAIGFPLALAAIARASRLSWGATTAAAIYVAVDLASMWALQLTPAEPMLAPIFNPVTRMVPQPFPLLIVFPAIGIDIALRRVRANDWVVAAAAGVAFVVLMLAVHWFLADFLLSPGARNIVFGADRWDYNIQVGEWRHQFWMLDQDAQGNWSALKLAGGIGIAMVVATVTARLGLKVGKALSRVQR